MANFSTSLLILTLLANQCLLSSHVHAAKGVGTTNSAPHIHVGDGHSHSHHAGEHSHSHVGESIDTCDEVASSFIHEPSEEHDHDAVFLVDVHARRGDQRAFELKAAGSELQAAAAPADVLQTFAPVTNSQSLLQNFLADTPARPIYLCKQCLRL